MPTYQYRCTNCGRELEVVQKFSDAALTECPACGGRLRKVFSPAAIVFKGSGFYRTDSRSGSGKSSANGSAKKDEAKTEAKKESTSSSDSSSSSSGSTSSGSTSSSSAEKVA